MATVAVVLIICCKGKKNDSTSDAEGDSNTSAIVSDPLPAYRAFISSLDTNDIHSVSKASAKFTDLFNGADSAKADSAYVLFHHLYNKVGSAVNEEHLKDTTNYNDYVGIVLKKHQKQTPKKDKFIKGLKENGFTLGMSEGMTYVKQKRGFLATVFYPHVSAAMKQYLQQVDKENEEGFVEDAGLEIIPSKLVDRIVVWEDFLNNYPSFPFAEEIKNTNRGYTTFLLEGIDNTPLMEYDSKKLSDDYRQAYEHAEIAYPNAAITTAIKPYYQALQKGDNTTAKKLLSQYRKQGLIYDYSA